MNCQKFLEIAKAEGLEETEIYISEHNSIDITLFHSEIENYQISNSKSVFLRGKYHGKTGTIASNTFEEKMYKSYIDEIKNNAKIINTEDPSIIFKGSEKYAKTKSFSKKLIEIPIEEKIKKLYELENKIKEKDSRINEISDVNYIESSCITLLYNSYGLKLSQKNNYFVYTASVIVKEGEETKNNFEEFLDNDFLKFDVDQFANKVVEGAISQLGAKPCESKTYKALLKDSVVSDFISAYITNSIAENVQKGSSLFKDKLNKKIASNKLTIYDKPIQNTVFGVDFDGEGVATYNKAIIENGVLKTYLYNLNTALKDGVSTTGNAERSIGKIGTQYHYLEMKNGNTSFDEMLKKMDNGVYITDVIGLHSGLNASSGNFSLQAAGFLVENGKISYPLDLITVSGNLMTLFKNIIEISKETTIFLNETCCPHILIKEINVAGK